MAGLPWKAVLAASLQRGVKLVGVTFPMLLSSHGNVSSTLGLSKREAQNNSKLEALSCSPRNVGNLAS